jgi:hypothetical protein
MHSLTSVLDGGEWSSSCPGHFTPRERAPGTHWIGGWVGPRAILDAVKRKILEAYLFIKLGACTRMKNYTILFQK